MATLIQSLSWTLILSAGQGFLVFSLLWLVLKLMPSISPNAKYHLSLSALTVLLAWFVATWWQQFHAFTSANEESIVMRVGGAANWSLPAGGSTEGYNNYQAFLSPVKGVFPWLSAFYFIGLMFMLVRLCGGVVQTFSLRKEGMLQPDEEMAASFIVLKNKIHFSGPVQLFISAKAAVPMVIGIIKPVILLPAATIAQLSVEQLETIIMHELAHIKRYDYLVNILQSIVETILFFNPFVWVISGISRRERELCCDDMVLAHTAEPLEYATALAALANNHAYGSAFTVAASGRSYHTFDRIERILEAKRNSFSYSRMVAAVLLIAAITCSVAWLIPSIPKAKKDKPRKVAAVIAPGQIEAAPAINRGDDRDKNQLSDEKSKIAKLVIVPIPAQKQGAQPEETEENVLVNRLIADGMADVIKGFVVEKKQDKLYINGQQQSDDIAKKYLSTMKKEEVRVQVYSIEERQRMHPDASFMQLLLPTTFSSGCVDYEPKKPGC